GLNRQPRSCPAALHGRAYLQVRIFALHGSVTGLVAECIWNAPFGKWHPQKLGMPQKDKKGLISVTFIELHDGATFHPEQVVDMRVVKLAGLTIPQSNIAPHANEIVIGNDSNMGRFQDLEIKQMHHPQKAFVNLNVSTRVPCERQNRPGNVEMPNTRPIKACHRS
ncbi:MAG: hypothetical protein AAFO75_06330, partial [Pseudomonadota bacterium]